jgi:DNA-binding NarL/FixJ family response regulator
MGQPSGVCAVLRRLDPSHVGRSARFILAYGDALEQGDPAALVVAAQGLESAGFLAAAYDAARQAIALGAHPDAAAAARRARVIETRIGAVLSPSPTARSGIADLLTAREWAVASAAVTRARNREIADTLGLSHRTVENHLAAVYRKLGVSGRDELREVVAADAIA